MTKEIDQNHHHKYNCLLFNSLPERFVTRGVSFCCCFCAHWLIEKLSRPNWKFKLLSMSKHFASLLLWVDQNGTLLICNLCHRCATVWFWWSSQICVMSVKGLLIFLRNTEIGTHYCLLLNGCYQLLTVCIFLSLKGPFYHFWKLYVITLG